MIHQSKPRRTAERHIRPPTTPPAIAPALLCAFPLEESDVDAEKLEEGMGAVVEKSIALALAWLVEEEEGINEIAVVFAMSAIWKVSEVSQKEFNSHLTLLSSHWIEPAISLAERLAQKTKNTDQCNVKVCPYWHFCFLWYCFGITMRGKYNVVKETSYFTSFTAHFVNSTPRQD